jgi:hydrogenase nickel incorporation protein HypB
MCTTCGCGEGSTVLYRDPATGASLSLPGTNDAAHQHAPDHHHHYHHDAAHHHDADSHSHHDHAHARTIRIEQDILAKNQLAAERNRGWFAGREVLAVNLMGTPGAGKTSLLERIIRDLREKVAIRVIEGDQATMHDSERIMAAGAQVLQINTGAGCHLEAEMVGRAVRQLDPPRNSMLLIENVGNLVCPALFDIGEQVRVVVVSVTEGEDKPLKYPHMFRAADAVLLNKIDLLPHVTFDLERFAAYARQVNPEIRLFRSSAVTGEGTAPWYEWLRERGS